MIEELVYRKSAENLFDGWEETMIWSCIQGVMGHVYADHRDTPASAMAVLGDFCFFAGQPSRELAGFKPEWCRQDFMILVPQNDAWAETIESCYGDRAKKVTRYAMKKEPDVFDREKLAHFVSQLSPEYTIRRIDEPIFSLCKKEEWCRDLVSQFAGWPMYQKYGLGVVVMKDGLVVSGASSYSAYHGGIEIEIDTKREYQRKGLALVCGAGLISECLDRGIYPSWDAQNAGSAALAKKLGYHLDYEYTAYEIYDFSKSKKKIMKNK